jgi:hypothetical protein
MAQGPSERETLEILRRLDKLGFELVEKKDAH